MNTNKRDVESLKRGIVEADFYRFNAFNVFNGLTPLRPNQSRGLMHQGRGLMDQTKSNQIKPGSFFAAMVREWALTPFNTPSAEAMVVL